MVDPRVSEHARILVEWSTEVKKGDMVVINTTLDGYPLAVETVKWVAKKGGSAIVLLNTQEMSKAYYDSVPDEFLDIFPEHYYALLEKSDVIINIRSPENTKGLSGVPSEKIMKRNKALEKMREVILPKRWSLTVHPNNALAQQANMSLSDYQDFVYGATLLDWEKESENMLRLKAKLDGKKTIRIIGEETDITANIEGRTWVASTAKHNLPSGEVYTSPIETSVEGKVYFDIPFLFNGVEIQGVRLKFEKGEVVEFSAEKGQDMLEKILNIDPGARRLGEIGIGTNRGIKRFTLNMLFDEKIGDTIHLALGNAYPQCGGTNKSAVHVDIVKTMKPGKIIADGEIIQENGKFFWEK